jgi:hypothetical protein
MIGLSRVASWRWLDSSEHRRCCCCAEVEDGRLPFDCDPGWAFAHAFFSDSRCRVLLIELNPCPLRVAKCLTQVWIITALEYSGNPADVGHRSSEAPLAYGGEFGI